MNVLTVPRTVVALQYKALRFPSKVVEQQLVGRFLAQDSALRLGVERSLASLDAGVGRFLQDEGLVRRGTAVARKADALELASSLEEKAAQRKDEAEQALQEQKQAVAVQRVQAARNKSERTAEIAHEEVAEKRVAKEKAKAREQAAADAINKSADAKLKHEQQRLEVQQDRIETRTQARTAAPKAQLDKAVDRSAKAAAERSDADRLAQLAAAERESRQSTKS
jgi:hypothetical protein